jgi:outer membrane protein TolC
MPLDEEVAVLPNTEISTVTVDPNVAVKYALQQRMELRQKEISMEQNLFSLIQTKAGNEFKGSVSARVGLNALGDKVKNMYDNPTDNEQIGVSFSIPIFDWGAQKARIKSSEISIESNKIDFEEEKKNITISVRQLCRNLPTLIRQIEIKKKSAENAQRTYEINLDKYHNGNLTGMELQQYQSQLTSAKQAYTNAIISYKLELLNLKVQTLWDFEANKSYLPVDLLK